jgi:hypothetical protein
MAPLLVASLALSSLPTLALPGLNGVNVTPGEQALFESLLGSGLAQEGLTVRTARDVSQVLGLERQRQLLGCSDDSSCMTEIAGALGVDALVVGDIGQVGSRYTISVRVVSARSGQVLAVHVETGIAPDEAPAAIGRVASAIATQLKDAARAASGEPRYSRWWAVVPGAVTVGAAAAAVALHVEAGKTYEQLSTAQPPALSLDEAAALKDTGTQQNLWANVAIGVASAGAVATVLTLVFAQPPKVQPTVALSPSGAVFGVTGVLP